MTKPPTPNGFFLGLMFAMGLTAALVMVVAAVVGAWFAVKLSTLPPPPERPATPSTAPAPSPDTSNTDSEAPAASRTVCRPNLCNG